MYTTPLSKKVAALTGYRHVATNVELTREEWRRIQEVYGTEPDDNSLVQARNETASLRLAQRDGLRIIAWLSKFCEPGQDPLKVIVPLLSEAGYGVEPEDLDWAEREDNEDWDPER